MLGCCQSAALATVAETAQGFKDARTAPYFIFVTAATDYCIMVLVRVVDILQFRNYKYQQNVRGSQIAKLSTRN